MPQAVLRPERHRHELEPAAKGRVIDSADDVHVDVCRVAMPSERPEQLRIRMGRRALARIDQRLFIDERRARALCAIDGTCAEFRERQIGRRTPTAAGRSRGRP